jgi:electron transport complex protein RnfG
MLKQKMALAASLLTLFAILGSGLVAYTYQLTRERISENERLLLLRVLNSLIPQESYDNDLFSDRIQVTQATLLGTHEAVTIYRARKAGQPVAVALTPTAREGYNGPIRLLVVISYDGTIMGVRVTSHQETPGIGDFIEYRRSNWILTFNGHNLNNPEDSKWKVRRDGGVFDHQTGATITPRAVVKAVHNTLLYYQSNREKIFASSTK